MTEHERQRGGTGVDVHRRTAGEVERLKPVGDPAPVAVVEGEDPVRDREVDQRHPRRDEGEPAPEAHPVGDRT